MMTAQGKRRLHQSGIRHVAPLLAVMIVVFDVPIAAMLAMSFSPNLTLVHYGQLVESPVYLHVIGNTLWIAAIATVACAALGYPLAYWMRRLPNHRQILVVGLVIVPFWVSVLVRSYAWIVVLGNAGLVNRTLLALGLIGTPVSFLYNQVGVTIGLTNVLLPYLVLPLFAAMVRIDNQLLQAAASLGASDRAVFWRVFFPLTIPALAAGAILVFISAAGFFITPAILGGGRVPMIANMLDLLINQLPRWELAAAISTLLLLLTVALYALYRRATMASRSAAAA